MLRKRSGMPSMLPERPKERRRRLLARRSWQRREPLRKQLVMLPRPRPPPRARKKAKPMIKLPSKIQLLLVSRRKLPHSKRKRGERDLRRTATLLVTQRPKLISHPRVKDQRWSIKPRLQQRKLKRAM